MIDLKVNCVSEWEWEKQELSKKCRGFLILLSFKDSTVVIKICEIYLILILFQIFKGINTYSWVHRCMYLCTWLGSPVLRGRNYWGTRCIKSGCRAESHPAGFAHHWTREMASAPPLHWGTDGSKCSVRVDGPTEKDQLSHRGKTSGPLNCGKTSLPGWRSWL